jgi:hypothetical protein
MPELYISNSSRQVHEVQWTDRRGAPHSTRITSGSRVRIGDDALLTEDLLRIIAHHQRYGLKADSASAADRDHAGLSYVVVDESSSNGVNLHALIALHGLSGETLAGRAYTCTDPQAVLLPLDRISGGVLPLEASKLEAILAAVAADVPLAPVHVLGSSPDGMYSLTDGHHRFAVSQVLGAATIPTQKVA